MSLLHLAWRSLRNRAFSTVLTVLTIALAVFLLLGVERVRTQARASFMRTVAGIDLIVGARAHPVQLLLYSVFHLGDAGTAMSWEAYRRLAQDPRLAWSVPVALGDSYRGHRVIGTTSEYFRQVASGAPVREGRIFADAARASLYEVVLGADVAEAFGHDVGDEIVLAHGTARVNLQTHDDRPFRVVGVLARSGTVHDRGVYVSLASIQAIHLNWRSGTRVGQVPEADAIADAALEPRSITAVFIGLKTRGAAFAVQRAINDERAEALSAIMPGVALQQLWSLLATVERVLQLIAIAVLVMAMLALGTMTLATLNERRREMAILRALGAGPRHVFGLMLMETAVLSLAGVTLALVLLPVCSLLAAPWLQARFGIELLAGWPSAGEWKLTAVAVTAGLLAGIVPALMAYRRSVQDGMNITV